MAGRPQVAASEGTDEEILPIVRVEAERCRRDFGLFMRRVWPVIEPGTPFLDNWHIDYLAEVAMAVYRQELLRVVVNIPPRYMKSTFFSIGLPAWVWANDPTYRMFFGSYDKNLAYDLSGRRRDLILSPWYRERFGDRVQLKATQQEKHFFSSTAGGRQYAFTVGGPVTGFGGRIGVVDDPLKPEDGFSKVKVQRATRWCQNTLVSRLDDKKKGAIVMVMQRLNMNDPAAWAIESGWHHVDMQGEAERRVAITYPLSGKIKIREEGEPLWPSREDKADLERQRREMGEYTYASQYQQRPAPPGGLKIKREWIRHWLPNELPARFDAMLSSWDLTNTGAARSDYVVGQVWGRKGREMFLLDQVRTRAGFTASKALIVAMKRKWPQASTTLIEMKANGYAVVEELQKRLGGVVGRKVDNEDKLSRLLAFAEPHFESGCVLFPPLKHPKYPWVKEFVERVVTFPAVAFDDEVDAMTQALERLAVQDRYTQSKPEGVGSALFMDSSMGAVFDDYSMDRFGDAMGAF